MISTALAILRKDLRVELRTRESVPAMALFAVTVFVLFHFGLDRDTLEGDIASGVIWVTLLLAALLGVNRLYVAERDQGGFVGMRLDHYASWAHRLSERWGTVTVSVSRFRALAQPVRELLGLRARTPGEAGAA